MDYPENCSGAQGLRLDPLQALLCGDFDLSIDFAVSAFAVPAQGARWTSLGVTRASDNALVAFIERVADAAGGIDPNVPFPQAIL